MAVLFRLDNREHLYIIARMGRKPAHASNRAQLVAQLKEQLQQSRPSSRQEGAFSTGCAAFDRLFPGSLLRGGSIIEWIGLGQASGAGTMSLAVMRHGCDAARPWILIDFQKQLYPLALFNLGLDLSAVILARPHSSRDALWAFEQALRCPAVAGAWAKIDELSNVAFRRLQLAVEESGSVGFLIRSERALRQPSWANVRLTVQCQAARGPSPRFRITNDGTSENATPVSVEIELDSVNGLISKVGDSYETSRLCVASPVVDPASGARKTGT